MRHAGWYTAGILRALWMCAACVKKERGDQGTKAESRPRPAVGQREGRAPARKPVGGDQKSTKPDPGAPRPARMDPAAFRPTVKKPRYPVVYKMVRTADRENVMAWALKPLGGARYVSVLSGRNKGSPTCWFRLLVLEKTGTGWTKTGELLLDRPALSVCPAKGKGKGKGKVGATLKISDYDWDGKPEAVLRYRFPTGPRGDGEIRKVAIVNMDGPTPRIAFKLVLTDNNPRFSIRQSGHFRYKDIDKDGRPELVVSTSLERVRKAGCKSKGSPARTVRKERRHNKTPYRWDYRTDTWVLAASRDALPSTMGIGLRRLSQDVGMTVGNLASGKVDEACMDPECLDVWGFPAISRDGKHIALVEEVPMWASWSPAPGFDTGHRGLAFELLRVKDGKLVTQVGIVDSTIRSTAYTTAQDQSCLQEVARTGQGDPRLCRADPRRVPMAMTDARADIKKRVAQAGRALWGMQFMPLMDDVFASEKPPARPGPSTKRTARPGPSTKRRGPARTIHLVETHKGKVLTAKVIERPSGLVLWARTFKTKYETGFELYGWVCPRHRVMVLRVVSFDESLDYSVHHAVSKLPRRYQLPDPGARIAAPAAAPARRPVARTAAPPAPRARRPKVR